MQRLARQVVGQPLLIVASYRSDERPELAAELSEAHHLPLARLPKAEIEHLSVSILGETTGRQSELTELLARETEGNVFFVVEVLRALAEEAGQLEQIGMATLPAHVFSGGMKAIVRRRLNRVPTSARSLLQAAAVAGRQIDPVLLGAIEAQSDVDNWLSTCAD